MGYAMMSQKHHEPVYLQDYKVPDFLIDTVNLEVELGEDVTKVTSQMLIYLNPASTQFAKDLVLNGEDLILKSVILDGRELDVLQYRVTEDTLTIYSVPEKFSLEIVTWIKPQENTQLSGLYKSSGNFCTQCEAQGFRRITYFLDRPDVMARYTTTIIADEKKYPILLSNGNLIASGKLDQDRHWAKWEDPFKKPSYLFALVAGDLEFIEDEVITMSGRRVTLRIFVEKGNQDKCAHAMLAVKKSMRWDEEKYGREYDLDIYMIVAVSDFNMGAMENKGLNIFNTKYILAKPETATDEDFIHVDAVIAHEYFHNWTGNRITCRDWFQLSLKEGLTIFRDQGFTADMTSQTVARIHDVNDLRITQFSEDAGPLAHPVRPDSYIEINNFYTATVYNKGSEVIRMMKTILGSELFHKGMDLYFARHDGQAVTIEDFVCAMEDASGVDLKQFRLWYSQAGTPVLEAQDHYDDKTQVYTLTLKQSCAPTPGQSQKENFHIPVRVGLLDSKGHELAQQLLQLKQTEETFVFNHITSRPIPSLLRYFSAPVKVQYAYSDAALEHLFKHDTDFFNRWEAGQKYAINLILRLVFDYQNNKPLQLAQGFIDALQYVMRTMQQDKLFLSELLTLPSERYIAEQMSVVDVEAIHAAREFLLNEIACRLNDEFLKMYQENFNLNASYRFDMEEIGKRRLRNICLSYLMRLPDAQYKDLGVRQFREAINHNMTDTIAALRCLSNVECAEREMVLDEFYDKWQSDALVVDKWFSIQAESKLPSTLANVKKLLQHAAFDIKNPNKVYALVAAFCFRNPALFHVATGEGYALLAELIIKLDVLNPSVAARMVKPLTDWKRYDQKRQQLIRTQLDVILQNKKISKDVYELVTKSLEY
jgi:aminopeptidase N